MQGGATTVQYRAGPRARAEVSNTSLLRFVATVRATAASRRCALDAPRRQMFGDTQIDPIMLDELTQADASMARRGARLVVDAHDDISPPPPPANESDEPSAAEASTSMRCAMFSVFRSLCCGYALSHTGQLQTAAAFAFANVGQQRRRSAVVGDQRCSSAACGSGSDDEQANERRVCFCRYARSGLTLARNIVDSRLRSDAC